MTRSGVQRWSYRIAGIVAIAVALAGVPAAMPAGAADVAAPESMPVGPDGWAILEAGSDVANTSIPAPTPAPTAAPTDAGDRVLAFDTVLDVNLPAGIPAEARAAILKAADIWESLVSSPVPIVIDATWAPMNPGTLGGAGATAFWRNFGGAPQPDTWYVAALANARTGVDLDPTRGDIGAAFNSGAPWYLGTDGAPPPGQYDLVSVALHEIGHGLGFTSSMSASGGVGTWGRGTPLSPYAYDRFVRNGTGAALLSFANAPAALGSQLVSNNLFFDGAASRAANGGSPVKLYAPSTWMQGSSLSHFDEGTFPAGNPNSLMTPILSSAEGIHAPGPIALGVLQDLGWGVNPPPPPVPVRRIFGQDAIDTALAISQDLFAAHAAETVVLARSDHFSDALAGGPLAVESGGPLLITPGAATLPTLDPRVRAEIVRVLQPGGVVIALGGTLALSSGIDGELAGLGFAVERVQGETQFSTATAIADRLGNPGVVFLATAQHFADALSAVPAAVAAGGAILLTDGPRPAPETTQYLDAHQPATRYAIGGPLAAAGAYSGVTAVYGQDLFATSAAVASRFFGTAAAFGAATGYDFPDALAGGVFMSAAEHAGPVVLVRPTNPLPPSVASYLGSNQALTEGFLFGGPLAVSEPVREALSHA